MTLNFSKNELSIREAYEKIASSSTCNEWVILEYEGTSNVIRVGDRGDEGIDEFCSCFSSGKLQYGVIGVRLSLKNVPKIVLVHWQGEGVPSARLASTTSHVNDVRRYLKTIHLTVYARSELDVDPDSLRKEVGKLPGTLAELNVESTFSAPSTVGSVYAPVRPHVDVNLAAREQFWNKANNEEAERKAEDSVIHAEREKQWAAERGNLTDAIHEKGDHLLHHREPTVRKAEIADTRPTKTLVSSRVNQLNHGSTDQVDSRERGNQAKVSHINSAIKSECDEAPGELSSKRASISIDDVAKGMQAVALWDYQAADNTEISFDPDDVIIEIQQVDEGWWSGKTKDGKVGLFPSNFVSLLS